MISQLRKFESVDECEALVAELEDAADRQCELMSEDDIRQLVGDFITDPMATVSLCFASGGEQHVAGLVCEPLIRVLLRRMKRNR